MNLKKKALWLIASSRAMFCATSETNFRATFKRHNKESNEDFTVIYARVNATEKFQDEFSIHLNVLQFETTLQLSCLGNRVDQTVDPYSLAKELKEHIRIRDQRLGMGVLAIDRIDKLTSAQQNLLINFFAHNQFPFSTLFILPDQDLNSVYSDNLRQQLESVDFTFQNLEDVHRFFKEHSKDVVFDQFGNFLGYTWDL